MKRITSMKTFVAFILCSVLIVSAFITTGTAAEQQEQIPTKALIQSVQLLGEGESAELLVTMSAPATYTSYKTSSPSRLVLDFSQTTPGETQPNLNFDRGPVKGVTLKRFDTDAGVLTRMEVFLAQDLDPVIIPSTEKTGQIKISFPGFKSKASLETPKSETEVSPAKTTNSNPDTNYASNSKQEVITKVNNSVPVITKIGASGDFIEIETGVEVRDYKTFRLNKPERVIIDIPGGKAAISEKLIQLNASGVSTARIGSYPDKVRIVLDSSNGNLSDANIIKTATGLQVSFVQDGSHKEALIPDAALTKQSKIQTKLTQNNTATNITPEKTALQVTAIDFQAVDELSRVIVKLNGAYSVENPVKAATNVSFRIKNAQLPKNLQRSLETREFNSPVLRITPVLVKTKTGSDVMIRVTLKVNAEYSFKHEADVIYLDFKQTAKQQLNQQQLESSVKASQKAAPVATTVLEVEQITNNDKAAPGIKKAYVGRKVTLEFADAEVRKIFQLLSEVSNKNFVLGDEVTGNISLKLVNVPWDQALDIILDTKGLDKREDGNIILVRGKGKFKSLLDEELEIRKATLKSEPLETEIFEVNYADLAGIVTQFNAIKTDRGMITSDARTNKVIVKDVKPALLDMRKILKDLDVPEKQVMIEARIVEAQSDFTRSLGISWGLGTNPAAGGKNWPFVNSLNSVFGGLTPSSGSSAIGTTSGAADITFGTIGANVKLSMRLNAAAKVGLIRVISSPKVATLNNKSAKITQGKQIPYISSTSDKVETKFVEAALSLEVTPHINNNGTIVLKIDAKNDAVDSTSSSSTPPINKKQATTEMLLRDGETTVIGGIFVDDEQQGEEGLPWLMDIPIFGNLFKSNSYRKTKTELLIFITPRILTNLNNPA